MRPLLMACLGTIATIGTMAGQASGVYQASAAGEAAVAHPSACERHDQVGFFGVPEILGELGQVYATCFPQNVCAAPTDLEVIEVGGDVDHKNRLWSGDSTTRFSVSEQDALIYDALSRAAAVAPVGKVIIGITFLRDIIVSDNGGDYVMYFRVTFARCSEGPRGMTWMHSASDAQSGAITVGCNGCDPYKGDTPCSQQVPLLCAFKPSPAFPPPVGLNTPDPYHSWAGSVVATTPPVAANTFATIAQANAYCAAQFGANWRVAEFHDAWGWNFQAYGGTVSAPVVPSPRFWVDIYDQPDATCWSHPSLFMPLPW